MTGSLLSLMFLQPGHIACEALTGNRIPAGSWLYLEPPKAPSPPIGLTFGGFTF